MFSPRNNGAFGGSNTFGSRYQYQTLPRGYEGAQSSALISKVMGLLAFSFIFAAIGSIAGFSIIHTMTSFWIVAIAGFVVLIALNMLIQRPGINLFLLYLFTFLEGMSLSPLLSAYIGAGTTYTNILGEAFLITAVTTLALSVYSWTTKRDFSRLADYLFFGVILLLVVSVMGIFFSSFFNTSLVSLIISGFGVAIFSGYVLYYVQRARSMADTMPNAIGLTVSLFITVLNLFLYILRILTILQGGDRRR